VVTVGDELLFGERDDGNRRWLLERLHRRGHPAEVALSLPDDLEAIAHWLAALKRRGCHPVLVAGGLGGTHDDCTRQAVAAALERRLVLHPEADALLTARYGDRYTDQRRRMAWLPEGCALLPNTRGAPGFHVDGVFGLPGFPEMLQPMAEAVMDATLHPSVGKLATIEATLPVQEGDVALEVEAFATSHPTARIGIYPVAGGGPPAVTLRLRAPADADATRDAFNALVARLREAFG
jgi:molybdopterin-biosynthesis enzyme MoeA-like protein